MKIIAEAGATKTAWTAVRSDGSCTTVHGAGINAATMSSSDVAALIRSAVAELNPSGESVTEVHFYGAGVLSDELASLFPEGEVECASDLLAAARAVCGHGSGIAAIMGTGSNSCFYDGRQIVKNVRSGGFILGDEGGGASLGRMFISDFLKGLVPADVAEPFAQTHEADYMTVVRNVYKGAAPSAYLGSFAPWILEHADGSEYLRGLVCANFRAFCERALCQYDIQTWPVGIVGGFAAAARRYLEPVAAEYGIRISGIYPDISDLLISYHR